MPISHAYGEAERFERWAMERYREEQSDHNGSESSQFVVDVASVALFGGGVSYAGEQPQRVQPNQTSDTPNHPA